MARVCNVKFAALPALLAESRMPDCDTCKQMLQKCGFNAQTLEKRLAAVRDKADPSGPWQELLTRRREAYWAGQGKPVQPDDDSDPFFIIKLFPELELLPPNFDGRKLPARCRLCVSRRQPAGVAVVVWSFQGFAKDLSCDILCCPKPQRSKTDLQMQFSMGVEGGWP